MWYGMRFVILTCGSILAMNAHCVTCHLYNRTPFDVIISLDVPLGRDKSITLPANSNDILYTGFAPIRGYTVEAMIAKVNEKSPRKILVYESRKICFKNLKCSLFIEPVITCEAKDPKKKLHLDAIKFWVVAEQPERGEETAL